MNRLSQALLFATALLIAFHGTAVADEVPEADRVVLVDFELEDVDDQIANEFYGNLRNILADEESFNLAAGGDVSMGDLWLMAGCNSTDADCLSLTQDFVDGDHLLYGSIEYSDGAYSISISLFDFEAQEDAREITAQTVTDDPQWLDEGIPAVIEHFVYGETGAITVQATGAPEAEIAVDGDVIGTGESVTSDQIAPGEALVTATGPDATTKEQRVVVRHEDEAEVTFEFDPVVDDDIDDLETPSPLPGVAATSFGIVGVAVGMVAQTQLSSTRDQVDAQVDDGVFQGQRSEIDDLQSDMDWANTLRFVGFAGGAVGLAAGGFLLYRSLSADVPAQSATARSVDLDVGASSDGVNAGFRLRF